MYFHDYDTSYVPSMPVVELTISTSRNAPSTELSALIDSGADTTVIPLRYLNEIGALPMDDGWLRSATGERHKVQLYEVYLRIGEFGHYLLVVADVFSDEAAIGRDILNHYVVTLDGIGSEVTISR